ncbi:MAG: outer membrane beta-barrel domain-containing protein [Deltaproteobacteria bacterium]|nr:outer membrane beta-barrel domain-containing protein [Deltaproteobacteria bacterium]
MRRALVVLFLLVQATPAMADDEETLATYAVQNRKFRLGHELHASVGVLPINAFTKGVTAGGGYTIHFSDAWAWEIAQFTYSVPLDTGLKKELLENFEVQPTQIETLHYFASTSLLLKPLYGKLAWFNRSVVHAEIFLALGAGVGRYENPGAFRRAIDAGGGLRLYWGRHLSVRLDARNYTFLKGLAASNELHLALSLAFSVGG